jgi:tetratricopeptide (TPR) repeat protein
MNQASAYPVTVLSTTSPSPRQPVGYEEAVTFYETALKNGPDRYAWAGRGFALLKLERYEEAVVSYDQALKLRPDETAWCHRGDALCQLGRYTEALISYDRALELDPDFDAALYGKATAYVLQGHWERALETLRQAIALSPNEYRGIAKRDPNFACLRSNLQFQRLLRRELPDAAQG